jgi:hypothetical protein
LREELLLVVGMKQQRVDAQDVTGELAAHASLLVAHVERGNPEPKPGELKRTLDPGVSTWSGIAYTGGYLWLAALEGERLWRINVDGVEATDAQDYLGQRYGRLRLVALGPEGRLWLGTSNHDGDGDPGPGDDQLLVINP